MYDFRIQFSMDQFPNDLIYVFIMEINLCMED